MRPIAIAVVLALGCAAKGHTSPPSLPDATDLGPAFLARQRVIATKGDDRRAFDAVLQYDGRELLLLGLTPMGTKAFAVRQRGKVATAETFVDRPLPAPPEAILLDVHLSYFVANGSPKTDGWHRGRAFGLRSREYWKDGRLRERVVRASRGDEVRIRYGDDAPKVAFPRRVVVMHERLGLSLEITTLSHDPIARAR